MSDYMPWGRRQELHTEPNIQWSLCDNCPEMVCKHYPKRREYDKQWEYYCHASGTHLTRKQVREMTEKECPNHNKLRRRFR